MGRKVDFRGTTQIHRYFAATVLPGYGHIRLISLCCNGHTRQGLLLFQPGSSRTRLHLFPGYRFAAKPPALCNPPGKITYPFITIFEYIGYIVIQTIRECKRFFKIFTKFYMHNTESSVVLFDWQIQEYKILYAMTSEYLLNTPKHTIDRRNGIGSAQAG